MMTMAKLNSFSISGGRFISLLIIILNVIFNHMTICNGQEYYGVKIGDLQTYAHLVKGEVYALNNKQLFIKGLSYDGAGPDAFFYVGVSGRPSANGIIIPDENNSLDKLGRYSNEDIVLNLPENMEMSELRWFSVWCRAFASNFGDLIVPNSFSPPQPFTMNGLPSKRFNHNVKSGPITFLNEKTMMIDSFYYDGSAPDVYFLVGTTPSGPNAETGIVVPDENGSGRPIKAYTGQTVVLSLPSDLRAEDIRWISIFCRQYSQDFGSITVPANVGNLPSSMGFL